LVFHLCHNDDPEMRERMNREMDVILEKEPGLDVFRIH
jgi:hypothetical protein